MTDFQARRQQKVGELWTRAVFTRTLADVRAYVDFGDSYERLPRTLRASDERLLSRADLRVVLGEQWTGYDNVGVHLARVERLLPHTPAFEMMTAGERVAFDALPERVTIYRGGDRLVNAVGLSWSLDRSLAASFPFRARYMAKDPVLVTAAVLRRHIVALKLDRHEKEIIVRRQYVERLAVEPLSPPRE